MRFCSMPKYAYLVALTISTTTSSLIRMRNRQVQALRLPVVSVNPPHISYAWVSSLNRQREPLSLKVLHYLKTHVLKLYFLSEECCIYSGVT